MKGLPRWCSGKESSCQFRRHKRCGFSLWVREIPWRREWRPTPVFLPGKFHGQKSLADYSPWGHNESDRTEWLISHSHAVTYRIQSCIRHFLCSQLPNDFGLKLCLFLISIVLIVLFEKEIATHFSILAWEIPWTEEPGGLHSTGVQELVMTQ